MAAEKRRLEEEVERGSRELAEAEGKARDLSLRLEEREVGRETGRGGCGCTPFSFKKTQKSHKKTQKSHKKDRKSVV